ncbi:hypothetical protein G6F61_015180 [Rhizopus arrhizus]|nr:hypothetical protein G6F61_015180 [Rhizopus arrhizus]
MSLPQCARLQFTLLMQGDETTLVIATELRQRHLRIVGEEQMHVARQFVLEELPLLVDQQLGIAVVAHGDRHVYP